jgi:hypothetical protein
MQLTGEEIDPEIAKLTRLDRSRDADDLARTTLQDDQISNANEVARDGDGVGRESSAWLNEANILPHAVADAGRTRLVGPDNHFLLAIMMVMVVVMVVEWAKNAISCAFDTAAKAVVITIVVVISHVVSRCSIGGANFFLGNLNVLARALASILDFVRGVDATAVFAFGDVELGLVRLVSSVAAVDLDVDSVIFCRTVVSGYSVSQVTEATKAPTFLLLARELYLRMLVVTSAVAVTQSQSGVDQYIALATPASEQSSRSGEG